MNNRPFKVIDPDTGKEITIWQSRYMASAIFVFTKDACGCWRVLANKRGIGCPDYVGYWCCPCGYLDYNETLKQASIRECKEETGVHLKEQSVKEFTYFDDKTQNLQNVTHAFYCVVSNPMSFKLHQSGGETNEVDQIYWIPISQIDSYSWAFGHNKIIKEIFKNRINPSIWKKVILKLYDKFLNPKH